MSEYAYIRDEDIRLLLSRLDDLVRKSGRGEAAVSSYLTPREAKYARIHLSSRLSAGTAVLWGGYTEAERVRDRWEWRGQKDPVDRRDQKDPVDRRDP